MHLYWAKLRRTFRNPLFCSNFCSFIASCHDTRTRQAHVLQVWCFFFLVFWWGQTYCAPNSLESVSCYWRIGAWLEHVPRNWKGSNARPLGDRNWVLVLVFVFHQLVPHWSPISCSLPSPGRLAPSRAEVFVGFRCGRLVQALPSSPPSAGLGPCPSTLRFFLFPCLFRVRPLRARGVGVCLLLPSPFAFPSSLPG